MRTRERDDHDDARHTTARARSLRAALHDAESRCPSALEVDMRGLADVDAEAIAELISAGRRARTRGGELVVLCDTERPAGRLLETVLVSRGIRVVGDDVPATAAA